MHGTGYHQVMAVLEGKITIGAGGPTSHGRRSLRFSRMRSASPAGKLLELDLLGQLRGPRAIPTHRRGE